MRPLHACACAAAFHALAATAFAASRAERERKRWRLACRPAGHRAADNAAGPSKARAVAVRLERPRQDENAEGREIAPAAGLLRRAGGVRHPQSARGARCPQRRPVRGRFPRQPAARLPAGAGQRQARRGGRLRHGPAPALRHRLPSRRQAAMGLCRQFRQRGAISLPRRRPEGVRRAANGRFRHSLQPSLDRATSPSPGRQDDVSVGRLRLQRGRGHRRGAEGRRGRWAREKAARAYAWGDEQWPSRGACLRSGGGGERVVATGLRNCAG